MHFSTLSWKSIPHPIPRTQLARFGSGSFRTLRVRAESLRTPPQLPLDSARLRVTQVYCERT